MQKTRRTLFLSGFLTAGLAIPAFAQSAPPGAQATPPTAGAPAAEAQSGNILQEVVVTAARKRSENVQTTPVTVTALSPNIIEQAHVNDLTQLGTLAPNLSIVHQLATADVATIYLRGFGEENNQPEVDPHVSLFLDGIYQPTLTGSQLDTFDLGGVEVDAGPQGTLLGKNAPIGAIYVTSARPTGKFEGAIQGEYGSYNHFVGRAKVDFPVLTDADGNSILAAHLSFLENEGGNWILDTLTNNRNQGGWNDQNYRASVLFTPSENFEWLVHASLEAEHDPQGGMRPVAFEAPGGIPGNQSQATQPAILECVVAPALCATPTTYGTNSSFFTARNRGDLLNASSNMVYRFEPVTVTSLTGLVNYWGITNVDVAGDNFEGINTFNQRDAHDLESEELRISSNKGGGWDLDGFLDWVVGGYFSNEKFHFDQRLAVLSPPGTPPFVFQGENGVTQSEAAFLHVVANLNDKWRATFGVRQSWDQKYRTYYVLGANVADLPAGFHNTSFEVETDYQFTPEKMAYFRFAQGYAAGGFSGLNVPHVDDIYEPELNNEYELGFKSDWFEKRLRVNVDIFINELSQLQLSGVVPAPGTAEGIALVTRNAGSATVEGMESQIIAVPTDALTVHATIGYLHPRYNQFNSTECTNNGLPGDCSGIPFSFASKWTMDLGGDYIYDLPDELGSMTFTADWSYRSSYYASDPPFPGSRQEGIGLVNLSLLYKDPSEQYSVEFFGTNVLDRKYKAVWSDSGGLTEETQDGRPAEWGMRLTYKFRAD